MRHRIVLYISLFVIISVFMTVVYAVNNYPYEPMYPITNTTTSTSSTTSTTTSASSTSTTSTSSSTTSTASTTTTSASSTSTSTTSTTSSISGSCSNYVAELGYDDYIYYYMYRIMGYTASDHRLTVYVKTYGNSTDLEVWMWVFNSVNGDWFGRMHIYIAYTQLYWNGTAYIYGYKVGVEIYDFNNASSTTGSVVISDPRCVRIDVVKNGRKATIYVNNSWSLSGSFKYDYYYDLEIHNYGNDTAYVDRVELHWDNKAFIDNLNDLSNVDSYSGAVIVCDPFPGSCKYTNSNFLNGSTEAGIVFPSLLLIVVIALIPVLLFRKEGLPGLLLGLFMLGRIGYGFLYVPVVLLSLFVVTSLLRRSIGEELGLLAGLFIAYMINALIIMGQQTEIPTPPSNPLEFPGWLGNLIQKAITFSYIPSPFNWILTLLMTGLLIFAIIRLIVRVIRGA